MSQSIPNALVELLRCPQTGQELTVDDSALVNASGEERYPLINGVPWLLPNPSNSLMDWTAKLNHFNQTLLSEIKTLEQELPRTQGATQVRLQTLLKGKQAFIRRVSELLLPVVQAQAGAKRAYDALRDRAPTTQNLLSYEANLYRDWVWGREENALTAKIVSDLLTPQECKRLLVLGAGAGRLALDLHDAWQSDLCVATDINPLLVLAAEYLLSDSTLPFVEFPLHPKKSEYVAVLHEIKGQVRPDNFHFVFSDAVKPCFEKAAFDTVVTPWFIDIQPLEFGRFLKQLNHYLPVGGNWINFGSLVFNQRREMLCYSIDEVRGIAESAGFDIVSIKEHEIPYLKSPYNAGHRMENVWAWKAVKTRDVKAASSPPQVLPEWLLDTKKAVPSAPYFQQFSVTHRTYAQLSAEVDGRTSVNKIAKKFAKQNRMDENEALNLVKDFFIDIHRQNN